MNAFISSACLLACLVSCIPVVWTQTAYDPLNVEDRQWKLLSPGGSTSSPRDVATSGNMVLLVAGDLGIFRSDDDGETWTSRVHKYPGKDALGIAIHPVNKNNWVVTSSEGIYTTLDYGLTWTVLRTAVSVWRVRFSATGTRVMVGSGMWMHRTRDRGGYPSESNGWRMLPSDIKVDTEVNGDMPTGPPSIFYSTNGGVSWTFSVPVDVATFMVNDITFDPNNDLRAWMTLGLDVSNFVANSSRVGLVNDAHILKHGNPTGAINQQNGVYGGRRSLYYTVNGGLAWLPVVAVDNMPGGIAGGYGVDITPDGTTLAFTAAIGELTGSVTGRWGDKLYIGTVDHTSTTDGELTMAAGQSSYAHASPIPSSGKEYMYLEWESRGTNRLTCAASNPADSVGIGLLSPPSTPQTSTPPMTVGQNWLAAKSGWDTSHWITTAGSTAKTSNGMSYVVSTHGLYRNDKGLPDADTLEASAYSQSVTHGGTGSWSSTAAQGVIGTVSDDGTSSRYPYKELYSAERRGHVGFVNRGWDAGDYHDVAVSPHDSSKLFLSSERQFGFYSSDKGASFKNEKYTVQLAAAKESCMSMVQGTGMGGDDVHQSAYNPTGYEAGRVKYIDAATGRIHGGPRDCINSTVLIDRSRAALYLNSTGGTLLVGGAKVSYSGVFEEGGLWAKLSNGTWILLAGGQIARNGLQSNEEVTTLVADHKVPDYFFMGTDKGAVYRGNNAKEIGWGAYWKTSLTAIGPTACTGAGYGRGVDRIKLWPNSSRLLLMCHNKVYMTSGHNWNWGYFKASDHSADTWTLLSETYTSWGSTTALATGASRVSGSLAWSSFLSSPQWSQWINMARDELVLASPNGLYHVQVSMHTAPVYTSILTATEALIALESPGCSSNGTHWTCLGSLTFTDVMGLTNGTYLVSCASADPAYPRYGNGLLLIQMSETGDCTTDYTDPLVPVTTCVPTATTAKATGEMGGAAVTKLMMDPLGERIFAVSPGRGVWEWQHNLIENGGFEVTDGTMGTFPRSKSWDFAYSESGNVSKSEDSCYGDYAQTLDDTDVVSNKVQFKSYPEPMRITGYLKKLSSSTTEVAITLRYFKFNLPLRNVYIPVPIPTHNGWQKFGYTVIPPIEATSIMVDINGTMIEQRDQNFTQPIPAPTAAPTNATGGRRAIDAHLNAMAAMAAEEKAAIGRQRRSHGGTEHVKVDHLWIGRASEDYETPTKAELLAGPTQPYNSWPSSVGTPTGNHTGGGPDPHGWSDLPGPPTQPELISLLTTSTTTAQATLKWNQGYNGGGIIQKYEIYYASHTDALNYKLGATVPGFVYKGTVYNLYRASLYFVKVLAVNQVGRGFMSDPLDIVTLDAKPIAPGKPVTGPSTDPVVPASTGLTSSTVTWRFQIPTDMGGLPVIKYKMYLWAGTSQTVGTWDNGTEVYSPEGAPGGVLTGEDGTSPDVRYHDGAGWYDDYMTTTFLRLEMGKYYKMKVMAANPSGYGAASEDSSVVQTRVVLEPMITLRLLYSSGVIFEQNAVSDVGDTRAALNASFVQEWSTQMGLPQNRFNIISLIKSSVYRLGKQLDFVLVKFAFLGTSSSTDLEMHNYVDAIKALVANKDSAIHVHSLVNRRLDFGYTKVEWPNIMPNEIIWVMPGSGVPSNRLSAAGSIALGTIFFMLIPAYLATWLPFYWAKRAEGLESHQIIELTLRLWWKAFMVYFNHFYSKYDRWSKTEEGKKCIGMVCFCYKKKEMKPEDIDPMTGMPFGFDPKYFPGGMPPEAMKIYEDNVRNQRAKLSAD